jgi:hypothetical protein
MSIPVQITASVSARTLASVRIAEQNRPRLSVVALAVMALLGPAACTGSPTTLALQPDFAMATSEGVTSVSVRNSLPGMTDNEFARVVRTGMERAAPGAVLSDPVHAPFPQFRIVWHVNPNGPRGSTSKLVVNIFNKSTPFAYEQAVVNNSAPPSAITGTVESMTRRLIASQTNPLPAT